MEFGKEIKKHYWVWDNILDKETLHALDNYTNTDQINWSFKNHANRNEHGFYPSYKSKGSHTLWGAVLYSTMADPTGKPWVKIDDQLWDLTTWLINVRLKSIFPESVFNLHEVSLNGQMLGMDGTVHQDGFIDTSHNYTLMLFINGEWENDWGGEFEFLESLDNNSKVIEKINYIPGRFIMFKGNIPHRGLGPLKPYVLRKTLVWRLSTDKIVFNDGR